MRFKKNKGLLKYWLPKALERGKITYEERLAENILRLNKIKLGHKSIKRIMKDIK
jgi:hypothetical protein